MLPVVWFFALLSLPTGNTPPPKNVERVIYEYVDRKKVLYFLR